MLNKRKKYTFTPSQINNYNKFLTTLDGFKIHTEHKDQRDNPDLCEKESLKELCDKLSNKFYSSGFASNFITGSSIKDANLDPNSYVEPCSPIQKKTNHYSPSCCQPKSHASPYIPPCNLRIKKDEPIVEIKEHINIATEINGLKDLLNLVNTYKYAPDIKYNIDMKALHEIKEPLEELDSMIGMSELKNNIVDQVLYFIQGLHKNKDASGEFMHSVIYGPPGTGKTEIAKIMGKIYSKVGILKNGTFKKVTRSDLVAGFLGQTALKTKDVIKEALGGVLFIDEAYSLGNSEKRDSFAKECIDTLCESLSDNKDDLMVIIAGYENDLKESFFSYNQGLDSRFTWRFKTDDYTAEDLHNIFIKKINDIGWKLDETANIKVDWFKKNKEYFKFYGRDIELLLTKTKIVHGRRVFCKSEDEKKIINLSDLDGGLKLFLQNEEVKKRKEEKDLKKYLYNTMYS